MARGQEYSKDVRARGMALLLEGMSPGGVAEELNVPLTTVKYWKQILKKTINEENPKDATTRTSMQVVAHQVRQMTLTEKIDAVFGKVLDSWKAMATLLEDEEFLRQHPDTALRYHQFLAGRLDGIADRVGIDLRDEEEQGQEILLPGDPRIPQFS